MDLSLSLNEKQTDKLADLCFDLAKGLLLGGFGLTVIRQVEATLIFALIAFCLSVGLVRLGLYFVNN